MRYLLLLLCCLYSPITSAHKATQDADSANHRQYPYRHEINFGIGGPSTDQQLNGNKAAGIPSRSYGSEKYSGALSFTYRYALNHWLALGCGIAWESSKGLWYSVSWPGRSPSNTLIGTYKRQVFTIAPEISLLYKRGEGTETYGGAAFGISWQDETGTYSDAYFASGKNWLHDQVQDNSRLHANFQITAIGWRIGRRLAGFAELGYGYKGMVRFGASLRFRDIIHKSAIQE